MKKIMVIAAVAFAAIGLNAATVNWTINNVQSPLGGLASEGWYVQVFDGSVDYSYDAALAGTITAAGFGQVATAGTVMKATGSVAGYSANDPVSLYAVVYDAATIDAAQHYIVSAIPPNKKIAAGGSDLNLSFGNMAGTTTANMFLGAEWQATQSIPEPTSGLLLLLGMAGLALKRKHA